MGYNEIDTDLAVGGNIPGVPSLNSRYYRGKNIPTLSLFMGGQYMNNGMSGGVFGVGGNIPLADNGNTNLSLYGRVGNIFQGGLEVSQKVPIVNNKLYLVGSAGVEGAFSLTNTIQKQDCISSEVKAYHDFLSDANNESSVIISENEMPYCINTIFNGHEVEHPDNMTVITRDYLTMETLVNNNTTYQNRFDLNNNYLRGYLKGELRYEGNNFFVGAGVVLRANTQFNVTDGTVNEGISINTDTHSNATYNSYFNEAEGHYIPNAPNLDPPHQYTYVHRYIDYDVDIDLNNINFNAAQTSKIGLTKPTLSVLPTVSAGYRINDFQGTVETDFNSVLLGVSYNLHEPLTTKSGPNRLYRQMSNKYESHLNTSFIGQTQDGINAAMLALDGHVALDDRGTGLDAGIALGNAAKGWLYLNKEIAINNNLAATLSVGAEGIVSLTNTDSYTSNSYGTKTLADNWDNSYNFSDHHVIGNGEQMDWEIHVDGHYTFNNNFYSDITNQITLPKHNIYTLGRAGIKYTNDRNNFNIGLNATSGVRIKYKPVTVVSNEIDMTQSTSFDHGYYHSNGYIFGWDDVETGNALLNVTGIIDNTVIANEIIDVNQYINVQTKNTPVYIPTVGLNLTGEYNIPKTNLSIGAQVGKNWEFGENKTNSPIHALGTLTLKIK